MTARRAADLNFRRKLEDQNFLVKFPLGLKGRRFRLPRGLVQGQKLTQILRGLTLPVAQIQNFDDLAIPFRAVATDIVTGDRVILDHGDLTTAMRASLSAPGVFSPVESEGRMLVDGGLSSNLPIDVAREMGVDILIVVDCGFPLLERGKLDSVATVSNQMLAILIRHNTAEQRKTLNATRRGHRSGARGLLLARLHRARQGDAHRRGSRARPVAAPRGAVGVPAAEFQRIVAARAARRSGLPRDRVPARRAGLRALRRRHRRAVQRPGGQARQRAQARASASASCMARATWRSSTIAWCRARRRRGDEPGYGLALTTRRNSWGPNYLRFGLQLQNDFEGNSSFNAAARGTLAEITKYGGEWVWTCRSARRRACPPRCICPWDIAHAGS